MSSGYDSWKNNSADFNGNTGTWANMTVDREAGLVYVPVEDPTSDFCYGGDKFPGDDPVRHELHRGAGFYHLRKRSGISRSPTTRFGTMTCLRRRWWPTSMSTANRSKPWPCPPSRASSICSTASAASRSGRSLRRRCRNPTCRASKLQRPNLSPPGPAPYAPTTLTDASLIDFTPELHAKAAQIIKDHYKTGPMYTPPVVSNPTGGFPTAVMVLPGAIGGTNWPGAGFDPESHVAFLPTLNASATSVRPGAAAIGLSDLSYLMGTGGSGLPGRRRSRLRLGL